jgi:hypothetical protein
MTFFRESWNLGMAVRPEGFRAFCLVCAGDNE